MVRSQLSQYEATEILGGLRTGFGQALSGPTHKDVSNRGFLTAI